MLQLKLDQMVDLIVNCQFNRLTGKECTWKYVNNQNINIKHLCRQAISHTS